MKVKVIDPLYDQDDYRARFLINGTNFFSLRAAKDYFENLSLSTTIRHHISLWIVDPTPRKIAILS